MNSSLEQENFPNPSSAPAVFASDPSSVIDRPQNPYYQQGVNVNYTAPAKWWNWLWNHISAWFADSKADRSSMNSEMLNVLSAAAIQPSVSNTHQLSKGIDTVAYDTCDAYDNAEENGHKINQPYVIGHTLYIPDTELL